MNDFHDVSQYITKSERRWGGFCDVIFWQCSSFRCYQSGRWKHRDSNPFPQFCETMQHDDQTPLNSSMNISIIDGQPHSSSSYYPSWGLIKVGHCRSPFIQLNYQPHFTPTFDMFADPTAASRPTLFTQSATLLVNIRLYSSIINRYYHSPA